MKSHEVVSTVHDEIISCSETKAKPDHSSQYLSSLLSLHVGNNLGTGMKFTSPIRSHLTSSLLWGWSVGGVPGVSSSVCLPGIYSPT